MDGVQIRLKLMLNTLGIPSDISSLENRILIQKAIFIAQEAGSNLGYSYSWYVHGPYSPELTKDYYILNNDLACGDKDFNKYTLVPTLTENIDKIKHIFTVPKGVGLSQEKWLELVASIIYWKKATNNDEATKNILKAQKKELIDYYPNAMSIIKKTTIFSQ